MTKRQLEKVQAEQSKRRKILLSIAALGLAALVLPIAALIGEARNQ